MKFNKNLLLAIFISATISTLSFAMDNTGFTPSKSSQRRAKRKAIREAQAAAEHEATRINTQMGAAGDVALSSAKPAPTENQAAGQRVSFIAKVKRNKLKTFALILALAEAADLTQAYFLKTTNEELKNKTLMQKAKLIASKTYTAKLLTAAKDGLKSRVIPGILDLKQKAQDYITKKKQTA